MKAVIAFGTVQAWRGLYVAAQGMPAMLGPKVWAEYQAGRLSVEFLKKHPGGFATFPDVCYCHDEYFAERDGSSAKDSKYFTQNARKGWLTHSTADPLHFQWAYVLEPEASRMYLLAGYNTGKQMTKRHGEHQVKVARYAWALRMICSLDGREPDWSVLEGAVVLDSLS